MADQEPELQYIIDADLTVENVQEEVIEKIIEAGGTQKERCKALIENIKSTLHGDKIMDIKKLENDELEIKHEGKRKINHKYVNVQIVTSCELFVSILNRMEDKIQQSQRSNKQKKDTKYLLRQQLFDIVMETENLQFSYKNVKKFALYSEKGGVPEPKSIPEPENGCEFAVGYIVEKKAVTPKKKAPAKKNDVDTSDGNDSDNEKGSERVTPNQSGTPNKRTGDVMRFSDLYSSSGKLNSNWANNNKKLKISSHNDGDVSDDDIDDDDEASGDGGIDWHDPDSKDESKNKPNVPKRLQVSDSEDESEEDDTIYKRFSNLCADVDVNNTDGDDSHIERIDDPAMNMELIELVISLNDPQVRHYLTRKAEYGQVDFSKSIIGRLLCSDLLETEKGLDLMKSWINGKRNEHMDGFQKGFLSLQSMNTFKLFTNKILHSNKQHPWGEKSDDKRHVYYVTLNGSFWTMENISRHLKFYHMHTIVECDEAARKKHDSIVDDGIVIHDADDNLLLAINEIIGKVSEMVNDGSVNLESYEENIISFENIILIQINTQEGELYLHNHFDEPGHDGMGIVIVTVVIEGNGDVIIAETLDAPQSSVVHSVSTGEFWIMYNYVRERCGHALIITDDSNKLPRGRITMNIRFGLHPASIAKQLEKPFMDTSDDNGSDNEKEAIVDYDLRQQDAIDFNENSPVVELRFRGGILGFEAVSLSKIKPGEFVVDYDSMKLIGEPKNPNNKIMRGRIGTNEYWDAEATNSLGGYVKHCCKCKSNLEVHYDATKDYMPAFYAKADETGNIEVNDTLSFDYNYDSNKRPSWYPLCEVCDTVPSTSHSNHIRFTD